jgi:hypothetical protein
MRDIGGIITLLNVIVNPKKLVALKNNQSKANQLLKDNYNFYRFIK